MNIMISDIEKRQLQEIELEMMIAVDSACKKLGINYFMVGGTLLGAVRHKGFIPWDDDIDIGMLRDDYEVFIKSAQEILPSELFIQSMFTDVCAPFNFTKIRNSNTTFIETAVKNFKMNHGIYIDIFPFDYYPESKIVQRFNKYMLTYIGHKISKAYYCESVQEYTLPGKIANMCVDLFYRDIKSALVAREKIYRSCKSSKLITNYSGAWGDKEIVPLEWFGEYVDLEFEGRYFKAPIAYDNYLRKIYGDYMILPPIEDRKGHHYAEVIDVNKPYTEFIFNQQ